MPQSELRPRFWRPRFRTLIAVAVSASAVGLNFIERDTFYATSASVTLPPAGATTRAK
jgi:hypothetical protein